MRVSHKKRITKETNVEIMLNIDGDGSSKVQTNIGFLDHMLELFTKHGMFNIEIKVKGDLNIDDHHTVEDIGIVLGQCFNEALLNKFGINRYGFFILPMDEVLTTSCVDLSGRYSFNLYCNFTREKVGDLSTELIYDFWDAFAQNAKINLIIKSEFGRNDHHKIEGIFKSVARALKEACIIDIRNKNILPSTKGIL